MTLGMVGEYLLRIVRASEYSPQFVVRERCVGGVRRAGESQP